MTRGRSVIALWLALLWLSSGTSSQTTWLGQPQPVVPGIDYFTSTDSSLVEQAGPIAAFMLRLDPARARLASVHANDEIMGLETVDSIAQRHQATAAVNGGFFNVANGDPQFVLKEAGELVSDTSVVKGGVLIRSPAKGKTELAFDQLSARVAFTFKAAGRDWTVPVAGVNTTRARGKLMLYTAKYNEDTDTAANGTEWVLSGKPLRVTEIRRDAGRTPIPRDGNVLSFGGLDLPEELAALTTGTAVEFKTNWRAVHGTPASRLNAAEHIVTGAGLLRLKGKPVSNWQQVESLNPQTFINMRHPRTLIGLDDRGMIWLAVIDGRQAQHSVGMNFADLGRLADRLRLTDALNLDGGGSTTMVIKNRVVNRPSDPMGPRRVSDAVLVSMR
jgi:exopolysaccharide biosynthesis protein